MPSEVLSVHFLVIPNSYHHFMGKKNGSCHVNSGIPIMILDIVAIKISQL